MKGKGQAASVVTTAPGSASALTLTRLLLNITFARLIFTLSVALDPVQDFFSGKLLFGRSVWSLSRDFLRWILALAGRLSAPVRHPYLRLSKRITLRYWHVVGGRRARDGVGRAGPGCCIRQAMGHPDAEPGAHWDPAGSTDPSMTPFSVLQVLL